MNKLHVITLILGCALAAAVTAKLPTPVLTEEQKAKAEEAKAKAAEAAKKAAADEARYQDRVAERYFREAKAAGKTVAPPTWVPPAPPPAASANPANSKAPATEKTPAKKS